MKADISTLHKPDILILQRQYPFPGWQTVPTSVGFNPVGFARRKRGD
jgi:hypothetical protein